MIIHDERFEPVFLTERPKRERARAIGKLGEELIVDLFEQHGIHAFRTVTSTHPIDVIIDEEYGAEVKTLLDYRIEQVRLSKLQRHKRQWFCKRADLRPMVIVIRKLEDQLLWTDFPADFEVIYRFGMKGFAVENMLSIRKFIDGLNGGSKHGTMLRGETHL